MILVIGMLMLGCRSQASGLPSTLQRQEIIFLLDSSQSMQESDPLRLIPETVLQMCAIMPSRYAVGIYTYSDGVKLLQPLAGLSRLPVAPLQGINYAGYTNTGAAMEKAVETFSADGEVNRSIVIISDGEIMLPTSEQTLASVKSFQEGMADCRKAGIKVYMLALGGKQATPQANSYASDITYEIAPDVAAVPVLGEKMLMDNWPVGKILRRADASGKVDLSLPVPTAAIRHLRVVVRKTFGDGTGGRLEGKDTGHEVCDGTSGRIFDIKNPSDNLTLRELKPGEQAELFPQLEAELTVETIHEEETNKVMVKIVPRTVDGEGQSLLVDDYWNGKEIPVWMDDDYYVGTVQGDGIWVEVPSDWQGSSVILPVFSEWGWNVDCKPVAIAGLAQAEAQDSAYVVVLAVGGCGVLLLLGLFGALRLKTYHKEQQRKPIPQPRAKWQEHYVGELTIRDIRTRSGLDRRVRVINLYRHLERIALPMRQIFHECQLPDTLPGLDGLGLHPGKKGIWLDNDSQATILKEGELVLRGTSCFMGYDEPIKLSFGDAQLSMTLVLKDLKPQS